MNNVFSEATFNSRLCLHGILSFRPNEFINTSNDNPGVFGSVCVTSSQIKFDKSLSNATLIYGYIKWCGLLVKLPLKLWVYACCTLKIGEFQSFTCIPCWLTLYVMCTVVMLWNALIITKLGAWTSKNAGIVSTYTWIWNMPF